MTVHVDDEACARFGLDIKRVESIARRIAKAAAEARALGLIIFGGSGSGSLRKAGGGAQNEIASLGSNFDGGDGGDVYGDT